MAFAKLKTNIMEKVGLISPKEKKIKIAPLALATKEPEEPKTVIVAVYGNEKLYMCRNNLLGKNAKFLGAGFTCKNFAMSGHGMAMVFDDPLHNIMVEIFEIDYNQLKALDQYHGIFPKKPTVKIDRFGHSKPTRQWSNIKRKKNTPISERQIVKVQSWDEDKKYRAIMWVYNDKYSPLIYPAKNHTTGYEWRGTCLT